MDTPLLAVLRSMPPGAIAVAEGDMRLTTGALLEGSAHLAAGMRQLGVKAGDTAVLAAKPDAGFIKIVYAAMMTGIRLAVIDPEMGRDNYREKLRQLQPQWAFVDSRLLLLQERPLLRRLYFWFSKNGPYFPRTPGLRIIVTGPRLPVFQQHTRLRTLENAPLPKEEAVIALPDDHEFLITYTSGTTATPKGVVHSIGALTASILQIADMLRSAGNRRIATHLPYFALIGLNAGVEAHLWDYRSSPAWKLKFIEKHGITTLFSPPCDYLPLMEHCEREGRCLPECLQQLFFGSAPVYRSFLERLLPLAPSHTKLTCMYGMTENLIVATIDGRQKAQLPTDSGDVVGLPRPGVEIRIGEDGEIFVQSPQLYRRYLHLAGRDSFHATGDLGFLDTNGRLVLTGRKKDMLIRRNFNLYPGLYEPTVNRIQGVVESAFVGVFDEKRQDEIVFLFVETMQAITEAKLRLALESGPFSIDREALPDRIVFENLPRRGRQSKVDKGVLRERAKGMMNF